jgi:DNA-binding LacI/PurR family transcriptional regulator
VLNSLERTLREHGYHVLISCYGSDHGRERDNLRFLLSNGVDGLVYFPEDVSSTEFHELSANFNIPIVQVDRCIQGLSSDTVLVNNSDAAYMAVKCLINSGHRRVGLISGPKTVWTAKERQVGYLRALSDHGIVYDDALMILGPNEFATGYLGFESLMALEEPPTAVFTTNYNLTMGLVTAAREQGLKIPDELAVFGFDCADICSMLKPPLPVVHQPEHEMGRLAAKYLIDRLEGCDVPPRVTELKCRILPKQHV